jgi:hypothetical protein
LIRSRATLSLGWLIDAVLEVTAPLVSLATPANQNFVFLAMIKPGMIKPLTGPLRGEVIRRYLADRDLPHVTVKDLRMYRGISEYNKTGNVFRGKKLLNQSSIGMTIDYLEEHLTRDTSASIIADAQSSILVAPAESIHGNGKAESTPASMNSHHCANPRDASKPHDENGFCMSYLWPFNDRCFILDFAPRPIAFVLRDYDALCDAQLRIPSARFERFYAARKRKIELEVLSYIGPELRKSAETLLSSLPPAPTID